MRLTQSASNEIRDTLTSLAGELKAAARILLTLEGAAIAGLVLLLLGIGVAWFYLGMGAESIPVRNASGAMPRCDAIGNAEYFWLILTTFISGIAAIFLVAEAFVLIDQKRAYARIGKRLPLCAFKRALVVFVVFMGANLVYLGRLC